jgi:hypothetical protein
VNEVEVPFSALLANGTGELKTTLDARSRSKTWTMSREEPPREFQVSVKSVRWSICWASDRYSYTAQRATNATFSGTLRTWPVRAWADGSIYIWDDFADLTNKPPQAYYRLSYP